MKAAVQCILDKMLSWFRRWRAAKQEFPAAWRPILEAHAPFYRRLDAAARARFEDKLKIFAATKAFIPAGGMVIDERVKLLVAACAARLSMNLPGEHFARLTEIVVYPSHYKHPGAGDDVVIFGEAHHIGTMVLSYDAVTQGLANEGDGHNTAMHELAHVLDAADGSFDGTPVLRWAAYAPWARVMSQAFLKLRSKTGARRRTVLRSYGATNEAEFFAVATEAFFEKPLQLRKKQPRLYEVLREYYRSDPAGELAADQPASGSSGQR